MQCLIAFLALVIGLVNSWDIAITTGDQLEFYTNKTKTSSEGVRFRDLSALAYDAVHNMLLFVDRQNDNASIFSYNLLTKKYQPLVGRRDENIQGIDFDPVSGKLFWTDFKERSIYWISLGNGSENNIYGNLLLRMDDEIPRDIAVDSCRGYIYWTNTNVSKPTIERVRFDGSERTVIIDTDIHMPVSIAIDQRSRKLYWADDKEGIHFSIESSNLNGGERKQMLIGTYHQPNSLTVSNDSIYWVDWGYKSVWKLSKNAVANSEPEEVIVFKIESPFGIVANYKIADQTAGVTECNALATISKSDASINETVMIPKDVGLFCLHGVKTGIKCKCSPGYLGDRCETSVCQNFCLHGDCSVSSEGKPLCKCNTRYLGERCELDICLNYCLNDGKCIEGGNKQAACKCLSGYEGPRCEKRIVGSVQTNPPPEQCNCTTQEKNVSVVATAVLTQTKGDRNIIVEDVIGGGKNDSTPTKAVEITDEFVETSACNDGWDPVRDPILVVLGVVCGSMCFFSAALISKILHLKRRPRIKKRIIVNKSATPLTSRPDHCEITIENCCNMNICETPCFEPRSTIRPTLMDSKPGKEEKRNLIANMETSDDLY